MNFKEERKLCKEGYRYVAGIDEAGRGPLAGPVVAAAVIFKKEIKSLKNFKDSKKLSQKQREFFYNILTSHSEIEWGIGVVSEKVIDEINILQATKLAMKKAVEQICARSDLAPDFLMIDGNFGIKSESPQKSIIKGDEKIFSIAAASIIAKVTRDRLMKKFHKKYPKYGFDKHKGYPTKAHFANLEKFGPCKIHRKSFYPVRKIFLTG